MTTFAPGTLVRVDYCMEGEEDEDVQHGQAEFVRVDPEKGACIRWIYDHRDVLKQARAPERQVMEALDFGEGDYALSNDEQFTDPGNLVGLFRETIDFEYDVETNALSRREEKDKEYLPDHLARFRLWLMSDDWQDEYGANLAFLLHTLVSLGRDGANAESRQRLRAYFFEDQEPIQAPLTCVPVAVYNDTCHACNLPRTLRWHCLELDWYVGVHCKARMEALQALCAGIGAIRSEAFGARPRFPEDWLAKKFDGLAELRMQAQGALAVNES